MSSNPLVITAVILAQVGLFMVLLIKGLEWATS